MKGRASTGKLSARSPSRVQVLVQGGGSAFRVQVSGFGFCFEDSVLEFADQGLGLRV